MKLPDWFVRLGEALMEENKALARPTLTEEERETIEGVIAILQRLKVYPQRPLKTRQDDIDTLYSLLERTK